MSEVILIASGKGGTGKTFVASNLGVLLAQEGKRVLLVDLDMGMRNMDLYLGLENRPVYNIMDVISGTCRIRQALIQDTRFETLYFISACPGRDERDVTPLHMEVFCEKVKSTFDYILIDCPAGIGEGIDVAMAGADKAVLVTEPDVAAVRDADVLDRYLKSKGLTQTCYIVNKVRPELMEQGLSLTMEQIADMLRSDLMGIIPWDDNIYLSVQQGIPISVKEDSYIRENLANIASRTIGTEA